MKLEGLFTQKEEKRAGTMYCFQLSKADMLNIRGGDGSDGSGGKGLVQD